MNNLFETNANNASHPPTFDADIIFTLAPYLQYEQIELDPYFRAYIESTWTASSILRISIQKKTVSKNIRSKCQQSISCCWFYGS